MSVAALAAAGCAGGGTAPTAPTAPDALTVTVDGSGYPGFRIELSCAVADREACDGVLEALAAADQGEACRPLPLEPSRIVVRGTIEGEPVLSVLRRRTTCEARAFDDVLGALGL